ncbi:VTT domain-containing protein [Usitatibacter palustris]|uniref:VTT domain-containing protein n=1 Tax=Usitatibacter palustris TaxID=2732487 RepID=A0A6M4H4P4_9PROT|nr:VTT domain-containing protein [Usitatibacter palustris]QJR14609.1 hypothetical protein DSM104440_01416 [Usitatibacter palustris]
MHSPEGPPAHALTWAHLWPSLRTGLWVVALFAAGAWLAQEYAIPIREAVLDNERAGLAVFVVTSVVAVLMPLLTNLPLVPIAVLAWGPWLTALLLLLGWVIGATLSFVLGRHARAWILRHFPSVTRHAQIDRLIHPRYRLGSLIMLRMTFPVDVLSYALGLFSPSTTKAEVALSTAIGAAPFALLFALLPTLSTATQVIVFGASTAVFVIYTAWLLRSPRRL